MTCTCTYTRVTVDYGAAGKERVNNPKCPEHGNGDKIMTRDEVKRVLLDDLRASIPHLARDTEIKDIALSARGLLVMIGPPQKISQPFSDGGIISVELPSAEAVAMIVAWQGES